MKLFLPDTNILIYGFANKAPFGSHLKKWIREKKLVFSVIVIAEFLVDILPEDKDRFEMLLKEIQPLPVDISVARYASEYRKIFLMKKYQLKLPDCLIAATAKKYEAILVTMDKNDFPMQDIEKLILA